MTDTESLDILIKAVQEYRNDLSVNQKILENAAIVCDAAMGSDDIAKKHIAKLNEALVELERTAKLAESVAVALSEEKARAVSVYED